MWGDERDDEKDIGILVGYTGDKCANCGRVRVELWDNGDKICEKCCWNQATNEYNFAYDL